MPNHLARENSPYLLQHANNPVEWYPWGSQALERARAEHKPIFLSIGYAACHWCHVMAHESFEDPETAALMNEHFVNIKVDREERPDLDSIYMAATQALTGSGGWPMSVFLTPDLRPFYAGTYFPPVGRYNLPSFKDLLTSLARAWREQPDEIERVSSQVLERLRAANTVAAAKDHFSEADLEAISTALLEGYDWGYGGWGSAPKFPQPMLIEFLLRRAVRTTPPQEKPLQAGLHALSSMARGGMYDVVGGGFSRYSTDNFWRVPHFEKMLYDNAQLARVYLHAWQLTRDPRFKDVVIRTLEFLRRELLDEGGAFYSSLDADSDGEEGKYYVWTVDQLRAALPDEHEFELVSAAYGLTERGNWEGKTVLQRVLDDGSLAARFGITPAELSTQLSGAHAHLLSARAKRVRPATDDKILTGWNGLALQAFAEAARFIDEPLLASEWRVVATRNAQFLLSTQSPGGRLMRTFRGGQPGSDAFLEDYASLVCGLLSLYETDFDERWFLAAARLAHQMIGAFADSTGGFFDTPMGAEGLLLRPKDLQDNATPSGSALASHALLRLASFADRGEYRSRAEAALRQVTPAIRQYPTAFGRWLSVADLALHPAQQVALVFAGELESVRGMLEVVNARFRPDLTLAAGAVPLPAGAPTLLADRPLKDGQPTAYVCENFTCRLPVTSPEELARQVDQAA